MKLFTLDPIEKAESTAKTKFRIFLVMIAHLFVLVIGLVEFHNYTAGTASLMELSMLELLRSSLVILMVAIVFPLTYLFNIHNLLRIIEKNSQGASK